MDKENASYGQISGLIVAHNEEEMIEDALKSLSFCDEIICVLDRCNDNTAAICKKYTDKIIEGAWEIEGERRNLGIDKCSGDYILELDADERVPPETAQKLKEIALSGTKAVYGIRIHNYIGSRLVKHGWAGSFGVTGRLSFFSKGAKRWGRQRIHPELEIKANKIELDCHIDHMVDKDIGDMIKRLNWYTDMRGRDMAESGKKLPNYFTVWRRGLHRAYKAFFLRKGYKEGKIGALLALMAALFQILSYHKALFYIEEEKAKHVK